MKRTAVANLMALSLTVCATTAWSQSVSSDTVPDEFVGAWRLVSWTQRLADGSLRDAPRSSGRIIYADSGHMCWTGIDPNRPQWEVLSAPTESELASAYRGMRAYCAAVEVNLSEGYVLHHVEIARLPHAVGITRKRWFTLEGENRLVLSVDAAELAPPVVESTLIWERL